jgi:hypothetical protein
MKALRFQLGLAATLIFAGAIFGRDTWRYARTDNFEMFSTASEKKSRQLLVELEQFRAMFLSSFPLRRAREPRATVVLFGSDRQFTPYKPLYHGKPKEVSGLFAGADDEVMVALTTDTEDAELDNPTETIFHEYIHMLFHSRDLRPPLWLNEGLAELYSTFRLEGNQAEFGRPKALYAQYLGMSSLVPLRQLFAVNEQSADYNEEERAGIFYAESWALAHYFLCGTDRSNAGKLVRFLSAIDEGKPAEESFRAAFGITYEKMEMALRNYLDGGQYYTRSGPVKYPDLAGKITFRPASDFERDLALLDLRWRVHRAGDVGAQVLALADKHPDSARLEELLAIIAADSDDMTQALRRWRRAAELNSDNAFVYVQLARARMQPELVGFDLDRQLPEAAAAELRGWLDRAVQLSPDYADAHELTAFVEAWSSFPRAAALNRVQRAVGQMSDSSRTLLALAVARWRLLDPTTSRQIIDVLAQSPRASVEVKAAASLLKERIAADAVVATKAVPK